MMPEYRSSRRSVDSPIRHPRETAIYLTLTSLAYRNRVISGMTCEIEARGTSCRVAMRAGSVFEG